MYLPQDAIVVVRGYEDGMNEADLITVLDIAPFDERFHDQNGDLPYYYGRYERTQEGGTEAVYISSTRDERQDVEIDMVMGHEESIDQDSKVKNRKVRWAKYWLYIMR